MIPMILLCSSESAPARSVAQVSSGMVITDSTSFRRGDHLIPHDDETGKTAAITIRGKNIVVDFGGLTLRGTPATLEPNERKGTAILVEGENITIRNLNVHGYKIGLIANGVSDLKLLDSDFSYNWKARLGSTREREDLADWMSFHHNENDEWLRFGAAIYLKNCRRPEVRGVRAVGGQCGLMLTRTDRGLFWNNNFSFLGAVGLGMYRSSDNRIMHNRIDWCVRGFSLGVYNRGQDSTGILIYEQSNRNTFAYNSVTHGGDGFFLWAGQTTMDTGMGGANDNLLWGNDFSHAPTNGIEATFSRNFFVNNLVLECDHGVWAGYSHDTVIAGNVFGYNNRSIALEHGQDNKIIGNTFIRDNESIALWLNDRPQDPNWGYPKFRDTRSRDYRITENIFSDVVRNVLLLRNTNGVLVERNQFRNNGNFMAVEGSTSRVVATQNTLEGVGSGVSLPPGVQGDGLNRRVTGSAPLPSAFSRNLGDISDNRSYLRRFDLGWNPFVSAGTPFSKILPSHAKGTELSSLLNRYRVEPLVGGDRTVFLRPGTLRGWKYMIVDQWGPYDFQSPLLMERHRRETEDATILTFEVLGPRGTWRVARLGEGITLDKSQGRVGEMVQARVVGAANDVQIELIYRGAETVDYRGIKTQAG
ncbi:MAG: right-handed parallel beta-helix repeat-containing protein, partial [Fimbriimonadaceae bacterium]|nr:right-handed parallel beta-helix repeat-containing protein [Fimbriimonadaceae bacterium]